MTNSWMIYGANGYTGELIAREAKVRGLAPVLAGRSESVTALAKELGFESRVFSLETPAEIERQLDGVAAVLHCAGPFVETSAPMVKAAIATSTHYLDITGEIAVFEACQRRSDAAKEAGCVLLPGVGFDVVPTDCLAAKLSEALPNAETLELAFAAGAGPSKGTAKTALKGINQGGAVRKEGRIKKVPLMWKSKKFPFADKERMAATIPWGDVSTAFYSTGIKDIEVYMSMPPKQIKRMRWMRPFTSILGNSWVQSFLEKRIDKTVKGPSVEQRNTQKSNVWGRVTRGADVVEATLVTAEAYQLTVLTALSAATRVAAGDVAPGTKTPSQAFGSGFIDEFEGTTVSIG